MTVLICKNVSNEGAGTIEDFLVNEKIPFTVTDLSRGEPLPAVQGFDTLLMMGGPMSVNEDDLFPYIRAEETLVRDFIAGGKRVLGVCLGAQIMAKALGARVYKGKEKEIGWYDIELTGDGLRDPLLLKLAVHPQAGDLWQRFKVFHWHGETFDIPEGAVHLASSSLFPHQAFRYGSSAYAFQFHIEVRKEMIHEWLKNEPVNLEEIGRETERQYDVYYARALAFYRHFFTSPR
ncbi:MAG: type 1 glutamine amidotransferase [Nitrospirales bacterium]|nr:type 1 glutamine amidotransferase [Nitrospirales bacterium]